jgi:hypothetical protein
MEFNLPFLKAATIYSPDRTMSSDMELEKTGCRGAGEGGPVR